MSDQSMRILMLSPQYKPIVGGYERAAERLSQALAARGHRIEVVTDRRDPSWARTEVEAGVSIRRLWCVFKPKIYTLTALASLASFLVMRGRKFDVWHVHQYGPHAAMAITLGLLLRRPVVLKLTNSGGQSIAKAVVSPPFAGLVAGLLKRASGVVALSRETRDEALAFGIPARKIHQLGNGVDTLVFRRKTLRERAALKRKLGLGDRRVVIYVGRLSYEKAPTTLIKAWAKARKAIPADWTLVVLGDGPLRSSLEQEILNAGIGASVIVAGQQPNIEQWMAAADIYVSSSLWEGLSNTLLEAMASGLPVAVTRVSGVSELVEGPGAGLAVDVGDDAGLASALVRLAQDDDLRARLGRTARLTVEQGYSLQAVADRHETLYRRLIAESTT